MQTDGCWLYILECAKGTYYVGTTRKSPEERAGEHNAGLDRGAFTYSRRPVRLVYSVHFQQITDAIACERQVKGWSRAKKRALIDGRFEALPLLSKRGPAEKF